jgi:hypothetical protein
MKMRLSGGYRTNVTAHDRACGFTRSQSEYMYAADLRRAFLARMRANALANADARYGLTTMERNARGAALSPVAIARVMRHTGRYA